ncbi:DUF1770-domain-containing protein [Diplocarpon rosae]|nr:DUF1770-domain-containing protein [Diplocarpon rosae]
MSSSLPIEVASTIQSASIKRDPSPAHDLNPSTAASQKQPVTLSRSDPSLDKYAYDSEGIDGSEVEEDGEEDIPYSVLKPVPRRHSFGPLPDLRFEQSYLASVRHAESNWGVAFITLRDQLVLPLVQGIVWSLALSGWRYWNRTAELSGSSVGAKVRRWWYKTNNWKMPKSMRDFGGNAKLASDMGDYYQNQSSSD